MGTLLIRAIRVLAGSILGAFLGMFYVGVLVFHLMNGPINLGRWSVMLVLTVPVVVGALVGGWRELKRCRRQNRPSQLSG